MRLGGGARLISYLVLDRFASGARCARWKSQLSIGQGRALDPDPPISWIPSIFPRTPVPPLHADQADHIPTLRPIFAVYVDVSPGESNVGTAIYLNTNKTLTHSRIRAARPCYMSS